jgi:hypothetical protein
MLFAQAVAVERLAFEAENGLGVHIPRFGDASAGRVALGNKQSGFQPAVRRCCCSEYGNRAVSCCAGWLFYTLAFASFLMPNSLRSFSDCMILR